MNVAKVRVTQQYEKLSEAIKEQIKLVYPEGFSRSLMTYVNREGKKVSALRFETDEKVYLIRMSVQEAKQIVKDDDDYDDEGLLKDAVKDDYEEKYSEIDYIAENIVDEDTETDD